MFCTYLACKVCFVNPHTIPPNATSCHYLSYLLIYVFSVFSCVGFCTCSCFLLILFVRALFSAHAMSCHIIANRHASHHDALHCAALCRIAVDLRGARLCCAALCCAALCCAVLFHCLVCVALLLPFLLAHSL